MEWCAGAAAQAAPRVDREANSHDEIAPRGGRIVGHGIAEKRVLPRIQFAGHLAAAADANAVGVNLITAAHILDAGHQVARAGAQMDVDPIPGVVEIADAVVEQLFLCGDGLPAAVVKGGRSVSGIVVGGEEPVGAEGDALAELGRVKVAGIGSGGLRPRAGSTDGRGEKQKQQ